MSKVGLVCVNCGLVFEVEYKYRNRRYCSKACYHEKPQNNPFYGKRHSDATRQKMSNSRQNLHGTNNSFYGKRHSPESRDRMSKTRCELIASGKFNPINQSRSGWFEGMRYHSYYELKRMYQLKDMLLRKEIIAFAKNTAVTICYEYEGKVRRYIPDFFIQYADFFVIEEVKGYEKAVDKIKATAAVNACAVLAEKFAPIIQYRILYKSDLFISEKDYRDFLKEVKI